MASAVVDAVFGSYDIKNAKQWRDEDLKHREQEKQWREDAIQREIAWRNDDLEREYRIFKLENEKRIIDARHSQLTSIAQLGALLSAFTMITMVEVSLPPDLNQFLLVIYAGAGVIVFLFMWMSMLICTLLLLAITRYVTHTLEIEVRGLPVYQLEIVSPFCIWWLRRCENEWVMAYRFFCAGISSFLILIPLLAWVQFQHAIGTCIAVTCICGLGLLYWKLRITSKWRYLVQSSPEFAPDSPLPTDTYSIFTSI